MGSTLRQLERAAKDSTRANYTAVYGIFTMGSTTSLLTTEYTQSPPKSQITISTPGGTTRTTSTNGSTTTDCWTNKTLPSRCLRGYPATDDPHSPRAALQFLQTMEQRADAGDSVSVSIRQIDGLTASCFAGQVLPPDEGLTSICFASNGLIAYLSSGRNGNGVWRLTSYVPSSAL